MAGIVGYGAYIPRLRIPRKNIVEANVWMNPALAGLAKGERSMTNWDEDSITLAVEAARDALAGHARETITGITFASTTMPFADRQNSALVAAAVRLPDDVAAGDRTGSLRAGTGALADALAAGGAGGLTLCVAADTRQARPASPQELMLGFGAAAMFVGSENVIAEHLGTCTRTEDFVDHFRPDGVRFDYVWEERWARDQGFLRIIPEAVAGLLEQTGVAADTIDHLIVPVPVRGVAQGVAKATGIPDTALRDQLAANCGDTGTAHPLLMLAHTLEDAKPGEKILLCGFGGGCDALLFETTDAIAGYRPRQGVSGYLARRTEEPNYMKFLTFNGLLDVERGLRADEDKWTALSALHRNRDFLTAFMGGRCTQCGTLQIPKSRVCVNPNCGAHNTQEDEPFADKPAHIMSWTADRLAYSIDPPAHYGMVQFDGGGRLMSDFTDVDEGSVAVDMPVRMVFRIKDRDEERGFVRYFWKAAPDA